MSEQRKFDRIALVAGGEFGVDTACVAAVPAAGRDGAISYHIERKAGQASAKVAAALARKFAALLADVGSEHDVEAAFGRAADAVGIPDILVNSAAFSMAGTPVADMSIEYWNSMLRIDFTGSFLRSRGFVHNLKAADRKAARNIVSIHSTVNAIAPGIILTPMNQREVDNAACRQRLERNVPLGRAGTPDEVIGVAVLLTCRAASHITGSTTSIDEALSLEFGQGA